MMLMFTLLSRAADSVNVAKVQVSVIQNQKIVHKVPGTGKVEGTREQAVFAKEGQKVEQVLVQEGQSVAEDEALLVLSADWLKESVEKQQKEVERLQRQEEDLRSKETAEDTKKSLELARAEENYDMAVSNGEINIANAQMEVDVAYQKLQNYYDAGIPDSSQEQALLDAIRAQEEALNQAIITYNDSVTQAERAIEDAKSGRSLGRKSCQCEPGALKGAGGACFASEAFGQWGEGLRAGGWCGKRDHFRHGATTTEAAAVILYEKTGQLRMTGTIRESEAEYVTPGQKAFVKGSSKKEIPDGGGGECKEDEQNPDLRQVSILLPENSLNIGETADFELSAEEGALCSLRAAVRPYGRKRRVLCICGGHEGFCSGQVEVPERWRFRFWPKREPGCLAGGKHRRAAKDYREF